jgi:hypothetical protein
MKNTTVISEPKKKRVSLKKLLKFGLETIDLFGVPVKLNFNGMNKIKTTPGSIVTIFVAIILFAYSVMKA